MSGKLLRVAAEDFAQHYIGFHRELLKHVPKVVYVVGPSRFPETQARMWLAYDDAVAKAVAALGAEVVDVRAETSDENLRMRPEFEFDDQLHGNARWAGLVMDKVMERLQA